MDFDEKRFDLTRINIESESSVAEARTAIKHVLGAELLRSKFFAGSNKVSSWVSLFREINKDWPGLIPKRYWEDDDVLVEGEVSALLNSWSPNGNGGEFLPLLCYFWIQELGIYSKIISDIDKKRKLLKIEEKIKPYNELKYKVSIGKNNEEKLYSAHNHRLDNFINFTKYFDFKKMEAVIAFGISNVVDELLGKNYSITNEIDDEDILHFFEDIFRAIGNEPVSMSGAEYSFLISAWRKADSITGSTYFAVEAYYALHTFQFGQRFAEQIDWMIFDHRTFEEAHSRSVPGSFRENELKVQQEAHSDGSGVFSTIDHASSSGVVPLSRRELSENSCSELKLGPLTISWVEVVDKTPIDLRWNSYADTIDSDNELKILPALTWHYRLTDLVGRDHEKARLRNWALTRKSGKDGQFDISVMLLTGPGGAGKTRLAYEVAEELKKQGWTVGAIPRRNSNTELVEALGCGLFLILDYPEERVLAGPDLNARFVDAILSSAQTTITSAKPVCLLLVSRKNRNSWNEQLQGRLISTETLSLATNETSELSLAEAKEVLWQSAVRVGKLLKKKPPDLTGIEEWLQLKHEHRLPLFAAAAGLNATLSGSGKLQLGGSELMKELAIREIGRVRNVSVAIGLSKFDLERMLSLAIMTHKGLSQESIVSLTNLGISSQKNGDQLLEILRATPWWKNTEAGDGQGVLERIEPDRPAAAFLALALLTDVDYRLRSWIHHVIVKDKNNFFGILSRLFFDISEISSNLSLRLENIVIDAMQEKLDIFLPEILNEDNQFTEFSSSFAEGILMSTLRMDIDGDQRGTLLRRLSSSQLMQGKLQDAIETAKSSIKILRSNDTLSDLDKMVSLSKSLIALSKARFEAAEPEQALKPAFEALRRLEWASNIDISNCGKEFIQTYILISDCHSVLGQLQDARLSIENADFFTECISEVSPRNMEKLRIESLRRKTSVYAEIGLVDEAIEVAQKNVDLLITLSAREPDIYFQDLANATLILAEQKFENSQFEEAVEQANRSVQMYTTLSSHLTSNFDAELAGSLIALSKSLLSLNHLEEALEKAESGLNALKSSYLAYPKKFKNLGQEAVSLYKNLTQKLNKTADAELCLPYIEARRKFVKNKVDARTDVLCKMLQSTIKTIKESIPKKWTASWAAPPLFGNEWSDIAPNDAEYYLARVERFSPEVDGQKFSDLHTVQRMRSTDASFYPGYKFVELQVTLKDRDCGSLFVLALVGETFAEVINSGIFSIDLINDVFFKIDSFSVKDYVVFYANYALHKISVNRLIENLEDMNQFLSFDSQSYKILQENFAPLRQLNGSLEECVYEGTVLFKDRISIVEIHITDSGETDLIECRKLAVITSPPSVQIQGKYRYPLSRKQ